MNVEKKTEINADVIHWLNKKTLATNDRLVLVEGFCFMLRKIKLQETVRVIGKQNLHQRFWKTLDRALNFNLRRNKKQKRIASLYQFYFAIAISENFVYLEDGKAKITESGRHFLLKTADEQLNFLLSHIW